MRTNTYILYAKATLAALLLSPILLACSEDEGGGPSEEDGKLYTVTLSLNPSSNGSSISTRADNPYWGVDDNATLEEYERHINDCVVAVFDSNGDWYGYMGYNISDIETSVSATQNGIMTITNAGTDADLDNDGKNDAKLAGSATIEIPAGKYTFFAFANLKSLNTTDETSQGTTQGTDLIKELITGTTSDNEEMTISYLNSKAINLGNDVSRFDATAVDKTYIPMSSYGKEITVEASGSMDITLFRMIGKVTITINNQTSGDLTLKSLEMGNFRLGNIFLVPYGSGKTSLDNLTQNDNKDSFNPDLPDDMNAKTESRTLTIEEDQQKIAKDMKASFTFYEFETDVESQTKEGFKGSMWLATNIGGRNNKPQELVDFSFMRRNDWLNIPVQILETDLETTIIGSRMPIGGTPKTITYPAAVAFIPILYHQVDYPGKITISFTFSLKESDGFGDVNFEFAPPQHEAGIQYTEAQLVENNNGLLYDEEKQAALDVPSKIAITETTEVGASATATMTLTTQELAYEGTAQIDLMLVVSYMKGSEPGKITVPYTITLTNGKEAKQEEVGGGN